MFSAIVDVVGPQVNPRGGNLLASGTQFVASNPR